jgi:hypothetical protein
MPSLNFFRAAAPATILFSLLGGGCGSSDDQADTKQEDFARPAGLQSALETPIIDCQSAALDCREAATDLAGRRACNDTLAQCLSDAADATQGIAQTAESCRDEGLTCLRDGTEPSTCRDSYEACVDAALNGGSSDDAGSDPDPVDPVTPPSLDADGGVLPQLPGSGLGGGLLNADAGAILANLPAPVKCTVELRICVYKDPSAAVQCADTARACLQQP